MTSESDDRLAKGTNLVDLVRLLRFTRRRRSLPPASPAAEALLQQRILLTQWYPQRAFVELIQYAWEQLLSRSEQAAYEMGANGGRQQLQGAHRALLYAGDPLRTVLAMRHTWRMNFNFGSLNAEPDGEAILFTLAGYEDVSPAHAFMTAGWAAGAAQMAGAANASAIVLKRPWNGSQVLTYRVAF